MRRVCIVRTVPLGARCIQNYDFTRLLRFSVKVFFVFLLKSRKTRGVFTDYAETIKTFLGGSYVQNSDRREHQTLQKRE